MVKFIFGRIWFKNVYLAALKSHSVNNSSRGRGGGLVDRATDSGPYDPSLIPLGEKKENNQKEAGVGPHLKSVNNSSRFFG